MITESVLNFLQEAFFFIFFWLNVPPMPEAVTNGISAFFEVLQQGSSMIGFFLPGQIVKPFFTVFFVIFAVDHGYPFIMWIVRKIPVSIN